jgi:DtxR family Mn-dependent transcriptional regulator
MPALSEKAEEILERLWMEKIERGFEAVSLRTLGASLQDAEVQELLGAGMVENKEEKRLALTPDGLERGEKVVRHHRLAERLLVDVFDMPEDAGDKVACGFEHIIKRDLEERICTLLGHPRFCPHNLPIPPGRCCKERPDASMKIVAPLAELEDGDKGIVAYLQTKDKARLDRLLALGILPGQPITLIQRSPSFVFRVGETTAAIDEDLANYIYIRLGGRTPARRRWKRAGLFGKR